MRSLGQHRVHGWALSSIIFAGNRHSGSPGGSGYASGRSGTGRHTRPSTGPSRRQHHHSADAPAGNSSASRLDEP